MQLKGASRARSITRRVRHENGAMLEGPALHYIKGKFKTAGTFTAFGWLWTSSV